jgi:hypothetical protein
MYNSLTRIQNIFGFFTTVAFVLGIFIALSDLTAVRAPTATIKPEELKVYGYCSSHPTSTCLRSLLAKDSNLTLFF